MIENGVMRCLVGAFVDTPIALALWWYRNFYPTMCMSIIFLRCCLNLASTPIWCLCSLELRSALTFLLLS